MRKNEYDLYVDDQIQSTKYQLTLKCKYHTKVSQIKKYFYKYIKQNIEIIHNDFTLQDYMIVDQIFSRYCQNIITICLKANPMIDCFVKHQMQYQNLLKQKTTQNEKILEELSKMEDPQSDLDTQSTITLKKCTNCGIYDKMIENYQSSILNLIEENEQLSTKNNIIE
ncbi:unnamed protein product [Paramecium pentaurelia]|uniref:Uncharacterized protein n=1 Tax=Paramecium pentaurelia TaxID=43138 RepID=A0A8S1UUC8_9CILI|nr:unnamed protein product [Paramecium pentaurelia]